MAYYDQLKNLSVDQLLKKIEDVNKDTEHSDQVRYVIFARCFENLTKSMNSNAASNTRLATKVYFLNIILTFATVVAALIAGYELIAKILNCL